MTRDQQTTATNPWQPMKVGEYRMLYGRQWVHLHAVEPDGACTFYVRGADQNNRPCTLRPGESLDCRPAHLLACRVGVGFSAPAGPWGWAAVKIEETR